MVDRPLGPRFLRDPRRRRQPLHTGRLTYAVVSDRVVFAGEALSLAYPGTVHGAYESGRLAADRLDNRLADRRTSSWSAQVWPAWRRHAD